MVRGENSHSVVSNKMRQAGLGGCCVPASFKTASLLIQFSKNGKRGNKSTELIEIDNLVVSSCECNSKHVKYSQGGN